MTIEYQYSREDVYRLRAERVRYMARRFRDSTVIRIYWCLLLPAVIAVSAIICGSFLQAGLIIFMVFGAGTISSRWHRVRALKQHNSDENIASSLLPMRIELLPDRFVLSNANLILHCFWHSFHQLRETSSHFGLIFSPTHYIAVPKTAFSDDAERIRFRDLVKAHEPAKTQSAV